jgi:protein-ribulosamine 3-kinase
MLQSHYQVQFIESIITESLGANAILKDFHFLYCGNFNLAARVSTNLGRFFIKWNQGDHTGMFESEAKCVELLAATNTIQLPKVYGYGKRPEGAYLMIDFVDEAAAKENYWEDLGQKLAQMHAVSYTAFGLHFNNYLGAIPQNNEYLNNGINFYIQKRLAPQVALALKNNKLDSKTARALEALYPQLHQILPKEAPALLHGDLWSGNLMVDSQGSAILVDPSAYYGLREAEIAFSTLFGGFDAVFYEAYHEANPLQNGFKKRIDIYNLYPLLVHLNLFGGGYQQSIQKILQRYQ